MQGGKIVMKNKRWKRQAKRLKGTCVNRVCVSAISKPKVCPYYNECYDLIRFAPVSYEIRLLETICKDGGIK